MSNFDAMSNEELCSDAQKLRIDSDTIEQSFDGQFAQKDLIGIIAQVISRYICLCFKNSLHCAHARAYVMVCCVYPFGMQARLSVNSIIPMRVKKGRGEAGGSKGRIGQEGSDT